MSKVHPIDRPDLSVRTGGTMSGSTQDTESSSHAKLTIGGDQQDQTQPEEDPPAYTEASHSTHGLTFSQPSVNPNATQTQHDGRAAYDSMQQPTTQEAMMYVQPRADAETPHHTDAKPSAREMTESCLRRLWLCPRSTCEVATGVLEGTCLVTGEVVTAACRGRLCQPAAMCEVVTVVGCMAAFICTCGCCCGAHEHCIDIR